MAKAVSQERADGRPLADRLANVDQDLIVTGLLTVLCAVLALTIGRFATGGSVVVLASATSGLGVLALAAGGALQLVSGLGVLPIRRYRSLQRPAAPHRRVDANWDRIAPSVSTLFERGRSLAQS